MARTAHKSLRVLVAEDNTINQRLATRMLVSLGHTGVVVGDGEQALRCLEQREFDVLLLDVMMPRMDGMQTLEALRARERAGRKHIPVVMATAHTEPEDQLEFERAGADGYLAKPLSEAALEAELQRVVQ